MNRIKDKNGETPLTIASSLNDAELEKVLRKSQAQNSLDRSDVAGAGISLIHFQMLTPPFFSDDDEDDEDGGSGSESD